MWKLVRLQHFIIAALFLVSGIGKLSNPDPAARVVNLVVYGDAMTAQSHDWIFCIIYCLSALEVSLATLLILNQAIKRAHDMLLGLCVVFSLSLLLLLFRGTDVPSCGCFGSLLPDGSVAMALLKNVALIVIIRYSRYKGLRLVPQSNNLQGLLLHTTKAHRQEGST